jgi:transposase InsO family protein
VIPDRAPEEAIAHRWQHTELQPERRHVLGPAVRSGDRGILEEILNTAGIKHILIRPHCPWQNGKVERFNRTLQTEWAYRTVFETNTQRTDALAPWLEDYNTHRRHSALGGLPPISRLSPT